MTTDYHAPIDGSKTSPKLAHSAQAPFRALLWAGLLLLAVGLIAGIVGVSTDGYEDEYAKAGALAFSGVAIQWAVPFLVGAGIIAGLGKREPQPSAE